MTPHERIRAKQRQLSNKQSLHDPNREPYEVFYKRMLHTKKVEVDPYAIELDF